MGKHQDLDQLEAEDLTAVSPNHGSPINGYALQNLLQSVEPYLIGAMLQLVRSDIDDQMELVCGD